MRTAENHYFVSGVQLGGALTAGYQHVQVLPDGIAGWVKAGKKTTSI